jgi:hypothetical protein
VFTPNSRGARFCRPYCRYKHRDRLRDPAAVRARVRRYYAENREMVLAKAAERRGDPCQRVCKCGEPTWSQKSPYFGACSEAAVVRRRFRKRVA